MTILEICAWLEQTRFAVAIGQSDILFPAIESIHVIALTFVVGSIIVVDLRLLGLASRESPVARLSRDILPWTWAGFGLAAITGSLLFSSLATKYYENIPFRLKFLLMALAGLNMLLFHSTLYRSVEQWGNNPKPPTAARIAGGLSIVFWIGVVTFGRWTGFV